MADEDLPATGACPGQMETEEKKIEIPRVGERSILGQKTAAPPDRNPSQQVRQGG
ncbi:hypothetical protein HQ520_07080 [bacterium]|nr:hypothetical protein [bacterium]